MAGVPKRSRSGVPLVLLKKRGAKRTKAMGAIRLCGMKMTRSVKLMGPQV